jgi:hypothetical protein
MRKFQIRHVATELMIKSNKLSFQLGKSIKLHALLKILMPHTLNKVSNLAGLGQLNQQKLRQHSFIFFINFRNVYITQQ